MSTGEGTTPTAAPGAEVHGHVSDVTGGQVAVGGRVFQIDAAQGSYVVINAESDVEVVRRPAPVLRPPPAFPGLVARTAELRRIRAALDSGRSVEVHGPGGIGKTALLRSASNAPLPDTTPDGVIAIPARLGTADTLAYVFDTCYEGSHRVVPRREELTTALQDLRLLVVIDDTSLGRDDIEELHEALPSSLLLLAGIEQRVFDGVEGIVLAGLPVDEGVELIQAAVGRELTAREREVGARVSEVLHGTPLELVRFASLVRADDGDLVSVARGFGVDAQPEDILGAVLRSVSVEEDAVLAALAAFDAPVGAGPVAAFTGHSDSGALLIELCQRGLVQGDDLQGWRARDRVASPAEDRQRAATVLAAWVRRRSVPEEVAGEIPAIASALRQARQDRRWLDAMALAAAAERPLALAGRWSAWRDTLDAGRSAAHAAGDEVSARFFGHQLAVMDDALTGVMPAVRPATTPTHGMPTGRPSPIATTTPAAAQPTPTPPFDEVVTKPRWGRVLAAAAAMLVLIGLAVGAVVLLATRDDQTPGGEAAATTVASTEPTTDGGTTAPPVAGAPNLVAFTLKSEPPQVLVGANGEFTVRVRNTPSDTRDVGPSEGGTLVVSMSGGEAELVGGTPDCTGGSDALRCRFEALDAGDITDFTVTLRGVEPGSVVMRTTPETAGDRWPTATRTFTVARAPCIVPSVVDMQEAEAKARLEQAELTAVSKYVEAGLFPGTVSDQDPQPGVEVGCGSAVTIEVSTVQ